MNGSNNQPLSTNGLINQLSGLDLSEFEINKPNPTNISMNLDEIIQDKFVEAFENKLVMEYLNQKTKLNQSFGIYGFNGIFKVVEEIPNS